MSESASTTSSRPPLARLSLALAYWVGLVWLFYKSWELVVWYIWFRFDPRGEGLNLSHFDKAKAWCATGLVWFILFATAWKFVVNVFSSRTPMTVLVRQVFSAAVMLAVGRWICGFSIILGWHLPPLWNPNYNWLPDFSLIPVVAALTLAVLGSIGFSDFHGFPLLRFIPEPWRQKTIAWIGTTLIPSKSPIPSGPKRWGSIGGYSKLIWLQWFRTVVLVYVMPVAFTALLFYGVWLVIVESSMGHINWKQANALLHGLAFALIPFFFIALAKSRGSNWTRNGLWLGTIAVAGCWMVSYDDGKSDAMMGAADALMVCICMVGSALSALATSQQVSREYWGPDNDQRFIGISIDVAEASEMYFSMFFRMLRPYFVSLVLFTAGFYLGLCFGFEWLVLVWPVAALLHAFVFRKLVWFEAVPYHYKHVNPNAGNVQDFVESSDA